MTENTQLSDSNDNIDEYELCRNICGYIDILLSDTNRWRNTFIYLCLQCLISLCLFITLITNALGYVVFFTIQRTIDYFSTVNDTQWKDNNSNNNITTCQMFRFFGTGNIVMSILLLLLLHLSSYIYVYLKKHYSFDTE